ncbi:MAG: 30S ribosomal protein S3 [bacterium]|nr:30S ribosomal protein S3 [bacterium]
MSHKVHPKIFRINGLEDWLSRWFNQKNFSKNLEEDFKIRRFFEKKFKESWIEKIEIERFADKLTIFIFTARPGLLIGRGGKGIEDLKNRIEKEIFEGRKEGLKLEIREVKDFWSSASLVAQVVASQIEKRIPFRRAVKQALDRTITYKGVEGVKIEVSGRLNGAEIARTEWLAKGRLPRHTLRADIDYSIKEANCAYGTIGVKVWIYKGNKK